MQWYLLLFSGRTSNHREFFKNIIAKKGATYKLRNQQKNTMCSLSGPMPGGMVGYVLAKAGVKVLTQ